MEIRKQTRILWDTCICIDFIQSTSNKGNFHVRKDDYEYFESIGKIWNNHINGNIEICASTLALVESVKIDGVSPPIQVMYVRNFFKKIRDNVYPVDIKVASSAQAIRSLKKIKLCQYDSIHLATASVWNISIVITRDRKKPVPFLDVDNKHKTHDGNYIRILRPQDYIKLIEEEIKEEERRKEEEKDAKAQAKKERKENMEQVIKEQVLFHDENLNDQEEETTDQI